MAFAKEKMDDAVRLSSSKRKELHRLIKAFEAEAAKFHDLRFSTFSLTQEEQQNQPQFDSPHHAVMLWQYYGALGGVDEVQKLQNNITSSDLQFGVRGAEISQFGILEGKELQLFIRMAKRSGALFEGPAAHKIKARVTDEIAQARLDTKKAQKPLSVINENTLAIWLNYLLYHLSLSPRASSAALKRIEPDPFSLSLLALERLDEQGSIGKIDKSSSSIDDLNFRVAVSFPGERRAYVADVVEHLRKDLGEDSVFYDHIYQSQLARPNLDLLLQDIYTNRAELLVVFLCSEYRESSWCGLEWRAIRDLMRTRPDHQVMFVRFDDNKIAGIFSIDGYIDARRNSPARVAWHILERLRM